MTAIRVLRTKSAISMPDVEPEVNLWVRALDNTELCYRPATSP
jgi:hypothetical protein